jgi:E3 ubiquitin-protein ligase MARCH6
LWCVPQGFDEIIQVFGLIWLIIFTIFSAFISLPYDPLETILADCFKGSIIVLISFCVILSLVWLRDQIVNGGGPDWLENIQEDAPQEVPEFYQ